MVSNYCINTCFCFDYKRKLPTHSEDDDFELEFELESDCMQEMTSDFVLHVLRKVACLEQRSL